MEGTIDVTKIERKAYKAYMAACLAFCLDIRSRQRYSIYIVANAVFKLIDQNIKSLSGIVPRTVRVYLCQYP